MNVCEEPRFVEIFKMIGGFFLKWTGSCRNGSKVTSFLEKHIKYIYCVPGL